MLGNGHTITKQTLSKRPTKKSIRNYSFHEIKGKRGTLSVMALQEDLDQKFPNALHMLGAHVIAIIMTLSRLVGMSMPGFIRFLLG